MAEFDTIAKHLIHSYPYDFVRFALQRDDLEVLDIIDTEQPTVETHRTDSLIRVRLGGEEALVHHEFQTTDSSPPMPRRMVGYVGRGIEQYGLPFCSIVLYLRPAAGRRDPGHYLQERHGFRVLVQYQVIRLSELEGQRMLDEGPAGLLPFAPLMQRPAGLDAEAWLRRCVQATEAVVLADAVKIDLLGGLAILSGLEYGSATIRSILSEEGLMDAIMRESSFAQYIIEQGMEQGMEQGIEQGIEQGERKSTLEAIVEVLEIRFGLSTAHPLANRIAAIDDVQRLKQLHRAAIQMPTLEAFRRLLDADE